MYLPHILCGLGDIPWAAADNTYRLKGLHIDAVDSSETHGRVQ
jgi:hypothetical protein